MKKSQSDDVYLFHSGKHCLCQPACMQALLDPYTVLALVFILFDVLHMYNIIAVLCMHVFVSSLRLLPC